jgi:hypothetical protein
LTLHLGLGARVVTTAQRLTTRLRRRRLLQRRGRLIGRQLGGLGAARTCGAAAVGSQMLLLLPPLLLLLWWRRRRLLWLQLPVLRWLLGLGVVRAGPCLLLRKGERDVRLLLEGHCMLEAWLVVEGHLGQGWGKRQLCMLVLRLLE